jgi:hypothetical protein
MTLEANDTRAEMFLRTNVTGSSVQDPPCVASYYCLFVYSLNTTDITKELPSMSLLLAVKLG